MFWFKWESLTSESSTLALIQHSQCLSYNKWSKFCTTKLGCDWVKFQITSQTMSCSQINQYMHQHVQDIVYTNFVVYILFHKKWLQNTQIFVCFITVNSSCLAWLAMYSRFILPMLIMFVVAYTTFSLFYVFQTSKYIYSLNTNELHNEQYR